MNTTIKQLPRALPALPIPAPRGIRVIWCDECGSWLPHSLTKSKSHYVCSCGTEVVYIVVVKTLQEPSR